MGSLLITLAWVLGTIAAIVVWRRLFPAPMPAWFDAINTWYRRRAEPWQSYGACSSPEASWP